MDSSAPIGIFDSGVGGLTVMRRLIHLLPNEKVVYFGDTARVPYGNKSKETVLRYTHQIIRFLETKQVKAIVIACNTASAYALHEVEKAYPIPIIGVIQPGAEVAAKTTKNNKVGVIGTYATIGSHAYEISIKNINHNIEVFNKACPLFVPFVEEGLLDDVLTDGIIARYLTDLREQNIDTLMLGCTHYPLLRSSIERFMGNGVTCVDPAEVASIELKEVLQKNGLLNDCDNTPDSRYEFYVSDSAEKMAEFANMIMPFQIENVHKVNIEAF
ncbi:MAG: glutamate racemase [Flexilinea sp.]